MANYSSFDQKITDDVNRKIEKENILNELQQSVLCNLNHFFDLVQKNLKDRRESTLNQFKIKCKEFINITNLLLNLNIQPHLIETGTMYLIYVIYESILIDGNDEITEQDLKRLERVFDRSNLNKKLLSQALSLCNHMFDLVGDEKLHYFFQDNLIRKKKMGDVTTCK